jgi:hypothetical protein
VRMGCRRDHVLQAAGQRRAQMAFRALRQSASLNSRIGLGLGEHIRLRPGDAGSRERAAEFAWWPTSIDIHPPPLAGWPEHPRT